MITRRARPEDAEAMAALLNDIIAIGGTTAHQHPKSVEAVRVDYIDGPEVQTSVVAEDGGQIIGWQSISLYQGESHIGTFVQPGIQARGVGAALFALTREQAQAAGITRIAATIRADNAPGLAYYARIGFRDTGSDPDFALDDGRVVGRIHRHLDL